MQPEPAEAVPARRRPDRPEMPVEPVIGHVLLGLAILVIAFGAVALVVGLWKWTDYSLTDSTKAVTREMPTDRMQYESVIAGPLIFGGLAGIAFGCGAVSSKREALRRQRRFFAVGSLVLAMLGIGCVAFGINRFNADADPVPEMAKLVGSFHAPPGYTETRAPSPDPDALNVVRVFTSRGDAPDNCRAVQDAVNEWIRSAGYGTPTSGCGGYDGMVGGRWVQITTNGYSAPPPGRPASEARTDIVITVHATRFDSR